MYVKAKYPQINSLNKLLTNFFATSTNYISVNPLVHGLSNIVTLTQNVYKTDKNHQKCSDR